MEINYSPKLKRKIIPIFVIGSMKCGTTTIFKQLESRSDICFPPIKEPGYFCEKMGHAEYREVDYLKLFDLNVNHKFIFDGSVNYTKHPHDKDVPKRIFEYGLRPKFIYIVRNPFDRIESHYNYMKKDLNWKTKINSKFLVDVSNYYLQLKQYEVYFNKEDFLILDFDDIKNKQKKLFADIFKHIGITEYKLEHNSLKSNVTKPVNRTEIKIRKRYKGKLALTPRPIKRLGKLLLSKTLSKKEKHLSKNEKKVIYDLLKYDMQKFKLEFNFPVEKWGF